jgi:NTE family protein
MAQYKASQTTAIQPNQVDPKARFGAYWGIDTDPTKLPLETGLPCSTAEVQKLAGLAPRLNDLGDTLSKQLINWGYAISDKCIRDNYDVGALQQKPAPK